jgi:hypothetical protein
VEAASGALGPRPETQGIELLLDRLKKTKSNLEFLVQVQRTSSIKLDGEDDAAHADQTSEPSTVAAGFGDLLSEHCEPLQRRALPRAADGDDRPHDARPRGIPVP